MAQEQARFVWDGECDWLHVQCLEDHKGYIMKEYLEIQSELEDELKEKGAVLVGSLIPTVENDLVELKPRTESCLSDDWGDSVESGDMVKSEGHANLRYPKGHNPVKTESSEHLDTRCPRGHGAVKNGNIQKPKGRGSGKNTDKRQAPEKKEYGF